jgi:hypothetical protein
MHRDCIEEIQKAVGRSIDKAEADGIEAQINEALKALSRAKPREYAAMTQVERLQNAAQMAAQQLQSQALLRKQRANLAVIAQHKLTSQFQQGQAAGLSGARAVGEVLEKADIYMKGVAREYFSNLMDAITAVEPRFFGFMEDAKAVHAFAREVLDGASGASGSKEMQKAARTWLDTIEAMRVRFNRAGGDIGRLAYGYLPQPHDAARVRAVARDVWANKVLPWVDRSFYVDLSGRRMGDAQVLDVLRTAHSSIATDGANTLTPGQFQGTGARANRGTDHRVIHFQDADAYLAYMSEFGSGSVFTAMQKHITGMGRDIGLVESFGPNPAMAFKTLNDMALKADNGVKRFGRFLVTNDQMFDVLSGKSGQVEHQRLADIAQGARNVQVFGKLQGAVLSSITDIPTFFITTRFNRLPIFDAVTNLVRSFGSDAKEFANRSGLISESLIADMNRWAESNLKDGWTSKLANATMKVSLLEGWTDGIRRAFSLTMMGGLGKISRTDWANLNAADRTHMEAKGVTPSDWKIWQLAAPEKWRESQMLTPESIRNITDDQLRNAHLIAQVGDATTAARLRDQAATRLLGVITDESEYASVAPDLHARTITTWGGQQRGTMGGELGRSIMLFKGFPISMMTRHWGRVLDDSMAPVSRTEYVASMAVGLTVFGALAMQLKDVKDGKDPRDMTSPKFWLAAFMQGGGTGFIGDLLYQSTGGMRSQSGVSTAASTVSAVAGPVIGSGAEFLDLTLGNLGQAFKGQETHFGAEAVRFARSHTPFVNLWYAKSAIDHAGLNQLQELLSPGYQSRMRERIKRDWGQDMWWPQSSTLPDRAPNLENAFGG